MYVYFVILSDGWTTNDLIFVWKDGDPVQVVKNLHLPRFTLETYRTDYCNSKTNTGKPDTNSRLVCVSLLSRGTVSFCKKKKN